MTKFCKTCNIEQALDNFYRNKTFEDGLTSSCKKCLVDKACIRQKVLRFDPETRADVVAYDKIRFIKRQEKQISDPEYKKKRSMINKNAHLKIKFGITLEDYNNKVKEQQNKCAICNQPEIQFNKKLNKIKCLAVDHCHKTGQVRGLLCAACNTALGGMRDSIENLQNAISYLIKHNPLDEAA